jgi:hypothetical protein
MSLTQVANKRTDNKSIENKVPVEGTTIQFLIIAKNDFSNIKVITLDRIIETMASIFFFCNVGMTMIYFTEHEYSVNKITETQGKHN